MKSLYSILKHTADFLYQQETCPGGGGKGLRPDWRPKITSVFKFFCFFFFSFLLLFLFIYFFKTFFACVPQTYSQKAKITHNIINTLKCFKNVILWVFALVFLMVWYCCHIYWSLPDLKNLLSNCSVYMEIQTLQLVPN